MSTVMPGVAGSEMVATTSPSRMTLPAETNMSSNPPSPALSQVEPLAMIRNFGRWIAWDHSHRAQCVHDAMNSHLDRLVAKKVCATALVGDDGDIGAVCGSSQRTLLVEQNQE